MFVTPGWQTTRWLSRSTSRMRFMRVSETSTPSSTGSAPPESPEPLPRATHGTSASWHARTTSETCCVSAGRTTARGRWWYCSSPSDS
jgi:hypothetical protein